MSQLLIFVLLFGSAITTSCNRGNQMQHEKGLLIENDRDTFLGRAITINGVPKFIWDLSLSESFYLEGLEVWEKKYLNRMIKIEGTLAKRYNHGIYAGQVIEDWEIIDPK